MLPLDTMRDELWQFTDSLGSFESSNANQINTLYYPLANEVLMSSISPDLHGDIKTNQNSFLLAPISRIDLSNSKSTRNFWIYLNKDKIWSATGVAKDFPVRRDPAERERQIKADHFNLEAGLLWHKIKRENKKVGLRAEILSFVPASAESVEIMQVKITNISNKKIKFIPTAAIPIYARSANNLRDHRHVTSLLNRISLHKFGVVVKPTLVFDESGHKPNKALYFVLGWDEKSRPPQYIYPTQEMFCGEEGDLEAPSSILKNILPTKAHIQGKEALAGLRFRQITLAAAKSYSYCVAMGIAQEEFTIKNTINKFKTLEKIRNSFEHTKKFWIKESEKISLSTDNPDFDNWFRWVSIQPTLRRIFGCSFLPDFDYGKGGRGWRDLWQDCLSLILSNPEQVRLLLINNFSGVRIDGSNATIIGKKPGEFISDRNNISRVWMDHATWPLLTLDLYLNETGDFDILFEQTPYFRNHELYRSRAIDCNWSPSYGQKLKTSSGKIYKGTLLEHILVEHLVQFFNVGKHNHIRLEGADWNDGLDMAKEFGESIAFSCMYASNLLLICELLKKIGWEKIRVAKEIKNLLTKIDYADVKAKQKILERHFAKTKYTVLGKQINLDTKQLCRDLKLKSEWMMQHIRSKEWLDEGFFNGYYDNRGERVEGKKKNLVRMILASQVFPIMSGVACDWQIKEILKSVEKYLFDKDLKGYHLNTDFSRPAFKTSGGIPPLAGKEEQHNLGRAFSFVYGDKENGAFFNHMIVMLAYSFYKRGYAREGWRVLKSIYNMALNTPKSKIYPCLPEYFNLEGRGMYSYLTGSASWFVLSMLTQAFGIRGQDGDLLIEPKLTREQFKNSASLSIKRIFAGRSLEVKFLNPQKLDYGSYKIINVSLNSQVLALKGRQQLLLSRRLILRLPPNKINTLNITLG